MSSSAASRYLGLSPNTLAVWRSQKKQCTFRENGQESDLLKAPSRRIYGGVYRWSLKTDRAIGVIRENEKEEGTKMPG